MKQTLTVTTPFGTFTRTTHHAYTHIVVGCGFNIAWLEATIADAERRYAKRAPAAHEAHWLEGTKRQLADTRITQAANTGAALVWCHSLANATKAACAQRRYRNVVGIFEVPAAPAAPATCAWFLKCDKPATTTREHPTLGAVPICARCDVKVARLDALAVRA